MKWTSEPQDDPVWFPDQVSLVYQGQHSHRYKALLVQLPAAHEYCRYLSTKYNVEKVWDRIDWLSFQCAMPKYSNRSPALSKFLHGWLAMLENVRKKTATKFNNAHFVMSLRLHHICFNATTALAAGKSTTK